MDHRTVLVALGVDPDCASTAFRGAWRAGCERPPRQWIERELLRDPEADR
ncbi:hypothetical protein [Cupriavidus basilensis]